MAENSGDAEKGTSFWKTLPGILTAVSTLVGAVTGLILAFNQIGFFKGDSTPTPPPGIVEQPPRASMVEVPSVVKQPPRPATVEVPPVTKMHVKDADVVLSKHGLRIGTLARQPTSKAKPGWVLHQNQAAGTIVERNTAVNLLVAVDASRASVKMPPIPKVSQKEAEDILAKHELRAGRSRHG